MDLQAISLHSSREVGTTVSPKSRLNNLAAARQIQVSSAQTISTKFLTYFVALALVVFGATGFFVLSASAQEADEAVPAEPIDEIQIDVAEIDLTLLEDTPSEVTEDTTVTAADLEVRPPKTLPDSPFYGFKNFFRGVQKTFTFDKAKKAKLEIRHASERVLEAGALLDKKEAAGAPEAEIAEAQEKVDGLLQDYNADLDSAIERIETIAAADGSAKVDRVLDHLTDKIFKQEKLIQKLETRLEEGQASEERLVKVIEHKERALEKLGNVLTKVAANPEAVADRIDRVIESQDGSKFRHVQAMGVLATIESRLASGEAKDAIAGAREKMIVRFENNLRTLPEAERFDRFRAYMDHSPGSALRQLGVVDEIKASAQLPEDVLAKMEVIKDKMARKFEIQLKQITHEKVRDKFLHQLEEGEALDNLRLAADLKDRVPEEIRKKIAEHEQASVEKFRQVFAQDQDAQAIADQAERLMMQIRERPDPALFRALDDLHDQLTPEQQKFVDGLETAGAREMARRFEKEGDEFFQRIASSNPGDIEIFERLGDFMPPDGFGPPDFGESGSPPGFPPFDDSGPPSFGADFNPFARAKEMQFDFIAEHAQNIDDPTAFRRFEARFDERPELRLKFEQRRFDGPHAAFSDLLEDRQDDFMQQETRIKEEFGSRIDEARRRAQEFGFDIDFAQIEHELRINKDEIKARVRERYENDEFGRPDPFPSDGAPAPFDPSHTTGQGRPENLGSPDGLSGENPPPFPGQPDLDFPDQKEDHFPINKDGSDLPGVDGFEEARRRRLHDEQLKRDAARDIEVREDQRIEQRQLDDIDRPSVHDNIGEVGNLRPGFESNGFNNPERPNQPGFQPPKGLDDRPEFDDFGQPGFGPGPGDFRPPQEPDSSGSFNQGLPPESFPEAKPNNLLNSGPPAGGDFGPHPGEDVRGASIYRPRTSLALATFERENLKRQRVARGLSRSHIARVNRLLTDNLELQARTQRNRPRRTTSPRLQHRSLDSLDFLPSLFTDFFKILTFGYE